MPKKSLPAYSDQLNGKQLQPESLMMSYGYRPHLSEGAIKCPIFLTSTFVFSSAEEGKAFFELAYGLREKKPKEEQGLIYSRLNNPDLEILEDRLTLWDKAESAAVFASGMAAISTSLLAFLRPGDVVITSEPIYGGTDYFFNHILPSFGIKVTGFRAKDGLQSLQALLDSLQAPEKLAMLYLETPANPTNELIDIADCTRLFKGRSKHSTPLVAVDNTFLGPVWQRPLEHGADLVLYSATKYIGGHSDVIAGVCLGSKALLDQIKIMRTILGTMAGPWTGWLLMRSLETLKLRMTAQMKSARHIANYLAAHPKVQQVHYLGLLEENNPQYAIYRKQCMSPGGMISIELPGGEAECFRFLNALKLFHLAVSLGGTESLAEHPASMTHSDIPPETQRAMGIGDNLVRLSIGVEHPEDLITDLEQALKVV